MTQEQYISYLKEKWFSNKHFDTNSNNLVYLVNSYITSSILYYEYDISILRDHEFDFLCKRLLELYDLIMADKYVKQSHKRLLEKDMLTAGSGYHIKHSELDMPGYEHIKLLKWIHDNE